MAYSHRAWQVAVLSYDLCRDISLHHSCCATHIRLHVAAPCRRPGMLHAALSALMHILLDDCLMRREIPREHHTSGCIHLTAIPVCVRSVMAAERIPEFWQWVSNLVPSTFGIRGFVRMNGMEARLGDVLYEYRHCGFRLSSISS